MPPNVDIEDLIDTQAIAELLGLGSRNAVSVMRGRRKDFPSPVINLGPGRPMLWLRTDVEEWARTRRE